MPKLKTTGSVLFMSIALQGCFGSDSSVETPEPVENVVVLPTEEVSDNKVFSVSIVNALSNKLVDSADVKLSFYDESSALTMIQDADGNDVNSLTTSDGAINFFLPGSSSVETLSVVLTGAELIEKRFDLAASSFTEQQTLLFPVALKNAAGVAEAKQAVGTADCVTSENTGSQGTPLSDSTSNQASITANTGFVDADGNSLCPTAVELSVVSVKSTSADDAEELSVADLIPAGFESLSPDTSEVLTPISLAAVNMTDEDGNQLTSFSQPLTISMSFPEMFLASEGRNIQAGDEISLASFSEDSGTWEYEGNTLTVSESDESGVYSVSFATDHLTIFSVFDASQVCTDRTVVGFTGSAIPESGLILSLDSSNSNFSTTTVVNGEFDLPGKIPASTDVSYSVTDFNNIVWGSGSASDICGSNISVELVAPYTPVEKIVTVEAVCEQDDSVRAARANAIIQYRVSASGSPFSSASNNGDGTYTLSNLVPDENYEVIFIPETNTETAQSVVGGDSSETFSYTTACSTATGAS